MQHPRRPTFLGPVALGSLAASDDPAQREEAAHTTARLLVQGARSVQDADVAERVVRLADEHGIDLVAELWSEAAADSLAGTLWRLYALRQWVHADPVAASRQYGLGRLRAPVLEVVAGAARLQRTAEQLEHAASRWRDGSLA